MSSKLEALGENLSVRSVGASVGLVPGVLALVTANVEDAFGHSMATAALILGVALGWAFSVRAASPGWRNGLRAAFGVAIWGVLLGSFLVAFLAAAAYPGSSDGSGVILAGLFGLVFLGIPMVVVTLVVALGWVAALKAAMRLHVVGLIPTGTAVGYDGEPPGPSHPAHTRL